MAVTTEQNIVSLEARLKRNGRFLAFSRLADEYRKQGKIQTAIDVCKQGLQVYPDHVTGHIILGRCYLEQEQTDSAISEFSAACMADRRNQLAMKMLADIFARQGMQEKAGDLYAILAAMDPNNPSIAQLTSRFKGTGKTAIFDILGMDPKSSAQPTRSTMEETEPSSGKSRLNETSLDLEEMLLGGKTAVMQPDSEVHDIIEETEDDHDSATMVTGDDIGERMAMLFKEELPRPEPAMDATVVEEVMPPLSFQPDEPLVGSPATGITSSDISNRIEQLFGPTGSEAVEPLPPKTLATPPTQTKQEMTEKPENMFDFESSPSADLSASPFATGSSTAELDVFDVGGATIELASADKLPPPPATTFIDPDERFVPSSSDTKLVINTEAATDGDLKKDTVSLKQDTLAGAPDNTKIMSKDDLFASVDPGGETVQFNRDSLIKADETREFKLDDTDTRIISFPAAVKAQPIPDAGVQPSARADIQDMPKAVQPEMTAMDEETVSGSDVAARLSEIFNESDLVEPAPMADDVPEGDEISSAATGFYSVSGDDVKSQETTKAIDLGNVANVEMADPVELAFAPDTPTQELDSSSFRLTPASVADVPDTKELLLDEVLQGDLPAEPSGNAPVAIGEIQKPADDILPQESAAESAEAFQPNLDDEEIFQAPGPSDASDIVSGADVSQRLSEIFRDAEAELNSESLPDDDTESQTATGFYTVSGNDVQTGEESNELLDTIGDVEVKTSLAEMPEEGVESQFKLDDPTTEMATESTSVLKPEEPSTLLNENEETTDSVFQIDGPTMGLDVRELSQQPELPAIGRVDVDQHKETVESAFQLDGPTIELESDAISKEAQPAEQPAMDMVNVDHHKETVESAFQLDGPTIEMETEAGLQEGQLVMEDQGVEIAGAGDETTEIDASTSVTVAVSTAEAYDIPDHVLTPTLADLYFQQGQFAMALKVYQSLCLRDPENKKLFAGLEHIRAAIAQQDAQETGAKASVIRKKALPARKGLAKKSSAPETTSGQDGGKKPLAGKKIKREYKEKRRGKS